MAVAQRLTHACVTRLQFSTSCLEVKRFKADKEAHRTGALLRFHFTSCMEPKHNGLP